MDMLNDFVVSDLSVNDYVCDVSGFIYYSLEVSIKVHVIHIEHTLGI